MTEDSRGFLRRYSRFDTKHGDLDCHWSRAQDVLLKPRVDDKGAGQEEEDCAEAAKEDAQRRSGLTRHLPQRLLPRVATRGFRSGHVVALHLAESAQH